MGAQGHSAHEIMVHTWWWREGKEKKERGVGQRVLEAKRGGVVEEKGDVRVGYVRG